MKIVRYITTFILLAVVLVTGYFLEEKLNEYRVAKDQQTVLVQKVRKGRKVDIEKLKAENEDFRAWLWLPDSPIDYPVVQGEDNDYYLHRNFDREYLFDGTLFIDSAVEVPFSRGENTVIYGHHMRSGAMFHDLSNYIRDDSYMSGHDTFIIETEDGSYDMKVVAYCNEDADSELYTTWFADDASYGEFDELADEGEVASALTKSEYVQLIRDKAQKLSGEPFDESDAFVTLSTCVNASGDARHQIIGVMRPAEKYTESVVTETEQPLFNKWLLLQIIVGVIMAAVVLCMVLPAKKKG